MSKKILLKFTKKGINLSPEAYNKIMSLDDPLGFSSSLIVKLKSDNYDKINLLSVPEEIIDDLINKENISIGVKKPSNEEKPLINDNKSGNEKPLDNTPIKNHEPKKVAPPQKTEPVINNTPIKNHEPKKIAPPQKTEPVINNTPIKKQEPKTEVAPEKTEPDLDDIPTSETAEKVLNTPKKDFKRNLNKTNIKYDFKILQDTSKKSYTSGELDNLITYFKSRYEKLHKILSKRPELKSNQKISEIEDGQTNLNLILMVKEIRSTKNGHKLVEFEDDTGQIPILFSNKDTELYKIAENLVKDEVVGVIADKNRDLAIGKNIIHPDIHRIPKKDMDFGIVFLSDIHVGSLTFLEDAFLRFIDWINCEVGSEKQLKIANDVKYLIIGGDIVDGIGIYPNQDKELGIKDITAQYDEAARLLGNIRSDIKIIIAPGNHDASRVAEPQPAVPEKYAKSLYELDNVEFISNPGIVSLEGIDVLIYHGRSFDDMAMNVKELSHERNDIIMEELLKKRHIAPIYGERTPLASELEDYMVIENIPDVFHTGHVHINTYRNYNGVHLINSGTFQTQTEFQKIYNIIPTPAEVPILHKGNYKLLKFI